MAVDTAKKKRKRERESQTRKRASLYVIQNSRNIEIAIAFASVGQKPAVRNVKCKT